VVVVVVVWGCCRREEGCSRYRRRSRSRSKMRMCKAGEVQGLDGGDRRAAPQGFVMAHSSSAGGGKQRPSQLDQDSRPKR